MLLRICKSKIHRARVTDANLNYEGSITIDQELIEASGLLPYEMVQVYNLATGARIETYVISGEPGSGTICINGAAARFFAPDDLVIIVAFALMSPSEAESYKPGIIRVDSTNRIIK
ncbi:aspartate 1-decarboxylase [bacterium]|nr:aspartate 1-decarboxylase [candidate division CSSED10-310 bacterium]